MSQVASSRRVSPLSKAVKQIGEVGSYLQVHLIRYTLRGDATVGPTVQEGTHVGLLAKTKQNKTREFLSWEQEGIYGTNSIWLRDLASFRRFDPFSLQKFSRTLDNQILAKFSSRSK
jgi:hypothetical protein